MNRRKRREQVFKILFRAEFHTREELEEQLNLGVEGILCAGDKEGNFPKAESEEEQAQISPEDLEDIRLRAQAVCQHLDEIDALLNEKAEKWKTSRMAKAELAILRLAVYEMKYDEDISDSIAINEAVELAKVYGAEQGASFVNGVLAKLV